MTFSHLDKSGHAKFVDTSFKKNTPRVAEAEAFVTMSSKAFLLLEKESSKKGNVLAVAQLAGIMAGKKTHELIPLCHLIPTTSINVTFRIDHKNTKLKVIGKSKAVYNTGVEMEALTAVSVAALTVYDMIKAVDKGATISEIKLVKKKGGKSGDYSLEP